MGKQTIISNKDAKIFAQKLKLSLKKTKNLLEERRDIDLILSQIHTSFCDREIRQLSPVIQSRLLLFKYAKDTNYDLDEKSYIADYLLDAGVKKIEVTEQIQPVINYKANEKVSKFNILVCCIKDIEYNSQHLVTMENGLKNVPLKDLWRHIPSWIKILKNVYGHIKSVSRDESGRKINKIVRNQYEKNSEFACR